MRQGDEVAGRYRLEDLQGHGPMSEVWRAHEGTLDHTLALKILSPTADLERFRREAQAVAALTHENVIPTGVLSTRTHMGGHVSTTQAARTGTTRARAQRQPTTSTALTTTAATTRRTTTTSPATTTQPTITPQSTTTTPTTTAATTTAATGTT